VARGADTQRQQSLDGGIDAGEVRRLRGWPPNHDEG
jgi:hypothetical protein